MLGVQPVAAAVVSKYGIVNPDGEDGSLVRVKSLVEKPSSEEAPSRLAVLGRYIIEPDIFPLLEQTVPGTGGEIQLTDALNTLAQQQPVWAYTFQGRRYDVGDRLGFLQATVEYALRREDLAPQFREYLRRLPG